MSQKSKLDTPIKKSTSKKEVTLEDLWDLINANKSSNDTAFKDLNRKLVSLETGLANFKSTINNLTSELTRIKEINKKLESNIQILNDKVILLESKQIAPHDMVLNVMHEAQERLSKEKNVILFNVPENPNEDQSTTNCIINEIFHAMKVDNYSVINRRLGKFTDKPRPILVELNRKENVIEVLKMKKNIRLNEKWKNVFIHMDSTSIQRSVMKNLCEELRIKRSNGDNSWIIKYTKGEPSLFQKN